MGFKEMNSLDADVTISLGGTNKKTNKPNPVSIEGYYLGKREVADKKKKSGVSYIYIFQTPKGNVGVWGKTDMDKKMQTATPGLMMRVSYTGQRSTPNGDMYTYKVEGDADNTIDVGAPAQNPHSGSSFDSSNTQDSSADEDDGLDALSVSSEEQDEILAAAAAAKRARTNALLKGKKVQ